MGLCDTYKLCHSKTQFLASSKTKFGMQRYVQLVESFQSRRTWAKLRGSASCLAIETGRYQQPPIEPDKRYCPLCRDMGLLEVEDEQHFLERCPVLQEARQPMMELPQGQTINDETLSTTTDKGKLNTITCCAHHDTQNVYHIKSQVQQDTTNRRKYGSWLGLPILLSNWKPPDIDQKIRDMILNPRKRSFRVGEV